MNSSITCFFAYPSRPESLGETIENAIATINSTGVVTAYSWKRFNRPGNLVIQEVCRGIDACDLFVCDLTFLNRNVLFELGYAVSKNRRVWIILDPSIEKAKEGYQRLGFLAYVIYLPYHNQHELVKLFLDNLSSIDHRSSLLEDVIKPGTEGQQGEPFLFYLKSEINTESSIQLTRRLKNSGINLKVDDPAELSSQTLVWYGKMALNSFAVVAHFTADNRPSTLMQNEKYAFVCGMAFGFGRKVLMVAEAPFVPQMDYGSMLLIHKTASECVKILDTWLPSTKADYSQLVRDFDNRHVEKRAAISLHSIDLGDHLAENEREGLLDYFVPTAQYTEALQGRPTIIFVGRKGSGKTANLVRMTDYLRHDNRYHVCVMEPSEYEQAGILELLRSIAATTDKGYVTESLWKFLIYTELARSVYEQILSRPAYSPPSEGEVTFLKYMDANRDMLTAEFAVRLENVIKVLLQVDFGQPLAGQRERVSETLHKELLGQLREHLGRLLENKKRVFVLLDNLDKAWTRTADLPLLSEFLFGLLGVSRAISDEFQRSGPTWRKVSISLNIFLRSDIFSRVMSLAREPDKIEFSRIDWNDPSLLHRVIEERILVSTGDRFLASEVWQRFFTTTVNSMPTRDYIVSRIMPRPRDIIYFCKAALASAIARGHPKIEADDVVHAEKEYSYLALRSVISEMTIDLANMEDFVLNFANSYEIVTLSQVKRFAQKASIPDTKVEGAISSLCDSAFLGLETDSDRFEFVYDESVSKLMRSKSAKIAEARAHVGAEPRYKINKPFHSWLDIRPAD